MSFSRYIIPFLLLILINTQSFAQAESYSSEASNTSTQKESAETTQNPDFSLSQQWSVGLSSFAYKPAEAQFNDMAPLSSGIVRFFTAEHTSLELSTGAWSHLWKGDVPNGRAIARPTSFGVNWYLGKRRYTDENNRSTMTLLFLGGGYSVWYFNWKYENTPGMLDSDSYSGTRTGYYLCAGIEHFMNRNLSGVLQIRSHHADLGSIRPATVAGGQQRDDRDIDLSNISLGAALMWNFR